MIARSQYDKAVQRLADDTQRALQRQAARANQFLGAPRLLRVGSHDAHYGESLICDVSSGAITLRLPVVTVADIGRPITVINPTGITANTVTCIPTGTMVINGFGSVALATAFHITHFYPANLAVWVAS